MAKQTRTDATKPEVTHLSHYTLEDRRHFVFDLNLHLKALYFLVAC